jgi:hypothetical protein
VGNLDTVELLDVHRGTTLASQGCPRTPWTILAALDRRDEDRAPHTLCVGAPA